MATFRAEERAGKRYRLRLPRRLQSVWNIGGNKRLFSNTSTFVPHPDLARRKRETDNLHRARPAADTYRTNKVGYAFGGVACPSAGSAHPAAAHARISPGVPVDFSAVVCCAVKLDG